ncbi:MAG: DUF504 domain-containing protein [Candidatus Helarchaeota archaeon]
MPESIIRKFLNQLKWDPHKNLSDYEITFLHRGAKPDNLKTYPAEWIHDIKISYILFINEENEEVVIPFHRIRRISNKKTQEIVWEKQT